MSVLPSLTSQVENIADIFHGLVALLLVPDVPYHQGELGICEVQVPAEQMTTGEVRLCFLSLYLGAGYGLRPAGTGNSGISVFFLARNRLTGLCPNALMCLRGCDQQTLPQWQLCLYAALGLSSYRQQDPWQQWKSLCKATAGGQSW